MIYGVLLVKYFRIACIGINEVRIIIILTFSLHGHSAQHTRLRTIYCVFAAIRVQRREFGHLEPCVGSVIFFHKALIPIRTCIFTFPAEVLAGKVLENVFAVSCNLHTNHDGLVWIPTVVWSIRFHGGISARFIIHIILFAVRVAEGESIGFAHFGVSKTRFARSRSI